MIDVFLKTLPFFALIGLGYWARYTKFFSSEATDYLTRFVFYFALSAMLFRFTANLSLGEIFHPQLAAAYLLGTAATYLIATAVGLFRRQDVATTAVEAQSAAIGNTGFLGMPMLVAIVGPAAAAPIVLVLCIDLIVFSSLIVILISGSRAGGLSPAIFRVAGLALLRNPMIVAISLGIVWSSTGITLPGPVDDFMLILGAAATPGALFAIGASLAEKSAERVSVALWISFCKLAIHPILVAFAVLYLFEVPPLMAGVVIASAAMPVAGNVFILAQHYGVAPQRVSAAILISTVISVVTVSSVIAWVTAF